MGQAYVYDEGQLGGTPVLLGEYGNGSTVTDGRREYLWLPTQDGQAIPIGLYLGAAAGGAYGAAGAAQSGCTCPR